MTELEQLICDLVAIESVNPDLVPTGSGEGKIATFVASWLRAAGLEVTVSSQYPAGLRWLESLGARAAGNR